MTVTPSLSAPVQALLGHAIDYAGLFPPAELDLTRAASNFLSYRDSPDAWALGRFVLPARSLEDFSSAFRAAAPAGTTPLPLSVVAGPEVEEDLASLGHFEEHGAESGRIEAIEITAPGEDPEGLLRRIPSRYDRYFEVPLGGSFEPLLDALSASGSFAKIRTGGTTASAFPAPQALARFLGAAARRAIPFKATAGLHHPLRGSYRLTYHADAAKGTMFGYLNVMLAAALARKNGDERLMTAALTESDPHGLRWEPAGLVWHSERLGLDELATLRGFFHRFGSCSFREPLDEIVALVGP